jgi:phosphate-selective porin
LNRSNRVDSSGLRPLSVARITLTLAACWSVSHAHAQTPEVTPSAEQPPAEPAPAPDLTPVVVAAPSALPAPEQVAAAAPDTTTVPPLVLPGPASDAARARLDYSDGTFYLRSFNDNLVIVPSGRLHVDGYGFAGQGVGDFQRGNGSGLKTNVFFRRFIIEIGGIVRKQFFFNLSGNFAPQGIDGSSPAEAVANNANVYDAFVGYMPVPNVRLYFGQYNAPFTMENVTSSRWMDMMERSLIIRTAAIPSNKADGLLLWADTDDKMFELQAGLFGGDGMNRPNIDGIFDGMARFVFRPLAKRSDALNRLQVGVSGRFGWRDHKFVQYDTPNMSTPGGYSYWSASYGMAPDVRHILPSSRQAALAAELYVPFENFDIRGEFVYVDEGRREVMESDRHKTLRNGALTGIGGYAQLSLWLAGAPRISGNPGGMYGVLKVNEGLGRQADYALQLVFRAELVRLHYDSNSRAGSTPGDRDATTTDITVNGYQVALNYWATKQIRLTAEYSLYQFPGTPKKENQAVAPGVSAGRADASVLHEISVRAGLAL